MNELLEKLGGGDLRSDGRADEVAEEVIGSPILLGKLAEGLDEADDVIRGRAAHALEKISRAAPETLQGLVPRFIELSLKDPVPMVRWHLAMIFGHMTFSEKETDEVVSVLSRLLHDGSVFVKSWAVTSLCLIGIRDRSRSDRIIEKMKPLQDDGSVAIRNRVARALKVLQNEGEKIPASWLKAGS